MLFPTLTFGLFFLGVFTIVWTLGARDNEWRKILLLVASWVFYGAWDWRFVLLLIASAFINWGFARAITRHNRQPWLALGVIANLGILGFFKYFGFFLEQLTPILMKLGLGRDLPLLEVVLPVGISFFTFQGMSYLIDVSRGKTRPASLLDITLLMSFFPHLVAGPIVRASHLVPQFATIPKLTRGMAAAGLSLIIWGLFKKAVIASELCGQLRRSDLFRSRQPLGGSTCCSAPMAMPCRSIAIFRPIPTWQSGWRRCSAIASRAISTSRIAPISLAGFLAALAYQPVDLAARLSLHLARRQSRRAVDDLPQPAAHHGARRHLARRQMDLRHLGRAARAGAGGGTHLARRETGRLAGVAAPARHYPHLPHRHARLDLLPRAGFRTSRTYLGGITSLATGAEHRSRRCSALLIAGGMAIHFVPPGLLPRLAGRVARLPAPALGLAMGGLVLVIDAMRFQGVAAFIYYQF